MDLHRLLVNIQGGLGLSHEIHDPEIKAEVLKMLKLINTALELWTEIERVTFSSSEESLRQVLGQPQRVASGSE